MIQIRRAQSPESPIKDAILIVGFAFVFLFLSFRFDFFERFLSPLFKTTEEFQVDEILILFSLLSLAFAVFAGRRWYELNSEVRARQLTETALRTSERLHNEAQQVAKIGHWELDSPSGTPVWSEEIFHLFGLDPKFNPPSFSAHADIIYNEDWNLLDRSIQELYQNGTPFEIEFRIAKPNNGIRWLQAIGSADMNESGRVVRMFGTAQDITERKQAEELLRESEEKYRTLYELESDAIFLIENETGKLLEVNKSACDIYGFSREELLQLRNIDLSAEPDKTKRATRNQLTQVPVRYHRKKDGTAFPVEITARHLKWRGREAHIAAIRDITFRVEAESSRAELEKELSHIQKMESIGKLAGGIAHEFNNILSIIIGSNELIIDELAEGSRTRKNAEEIRVAALRAKDVVRQLLTFSRKDDIDKKPIDIGSVVKGAVKLIRSSTPSNIDIRLKISDDVEPILGNATQVNQVLINLCSNATDVMLPKGGVISIELNNEIYGGKGVRFPANLEFGRYVKLLVKDNGRGMNKETLGRIFDPYFTTKEIGKGTGIGLAVVHGIIKGHNGFIAADSEPGKGTEFTILFPAYEGRIKRGSELPVVLPVGNERILLVDDEPALLKLGKRRLEKLGYTVETSTDPLQALGIFKADPHEFDLIITDMAMPGMTGDQLGAEIFKIRSNMPVMLCTGYSEKISERQAFDLGICSFAMKPLDEIDFANRVRKALDEARNN